MRDAVVLVEHATVATVTAGHSRTVADLAVRPQVRLVHAIGRDDGLGRAQLALIATPVVAQQLAVIAHIGQHAKAPLAPLGVRLGYAAALASELPAADRDIAIGQIQ